MRRRNMQFALAVAAVALGSCARPQRTLVAPIPTNAAASANGDLADAFEGDGLIERPPTPEQRAGRRDSLAAVRARTAQMVLERLAGKEKMRAGDVFASVELLQDTTVEGLLAIMEKDFGRALGVGCTFCHVDGQWDIDRKEEKAATRVMIALVNAVNKEQLAKLPPSRAGRTPTITCVTCHRGMIRPGSALMP